MTWSFWASCVSAAQGLDCGFAGKGLLGGAEALADHVAQVVVEHVLLGRDDLREAVHALGLRDRRLDQQDVRPRSDRVGPLHVQRGLAGPADHVRAGRVVGGNPSRGADDLELRRGGQAVGPVEDGQVVPDGRGAVGVDDDDGGAAAGHALGVQRGQAVGPPDLGRPVARDVVVLLAVGRGERGGLRVSGPCGSRRAGRRLRLAGSVLVLARAPGLAGVAALTATSPKTPAATAASLPTRMNRSRSVSFSAAWRPRPT